MSGPFAQPNVKDGRVRQRATQHLGGSSSGISNVSLVADGQGYTTRRLGTGVSRTRVYARAHRMWKAVGSDCCISRIRPHDVWKDNWRRAGQRRTCANEYMDPCLHFILPTEPLQVAQSIAYKLHDPETYTLLKQDTMPLIHESYDSLPCTSNLHNPGQAPCPMRVPGCPRAISCDFAEAQKLTRCRCGHPAQ